MDYKEYQSPLSYRYGSQELRRIWGEMTKRMLWRKVWVALAKVQCKHGLVQESQVEELQSNALKIDIQRALEIEEETGHDLVAEMRVFTEQSPSAASIIHLGATSADIEDNADILRMRDSLDIVAFKIKILLATMKELAISMSNVAVMGYTHLQPAEPTTLGYRMAYWIQDLEEDLSSIDYMLDNIRGKGFKGAVGTAASYMELLGGYREYQQFEEELSEELGIKFYKISSQVYPRKQDWKILSILAGVGATLHKVALDIRLMQSPGLGEVSEYKREEQVGSSAMPSKGNPIRCEKVCSLARQLSSLPEVAWHNAAQSGLERTLDDSANRRTILPEAFLLVDEIIITMTKVISTLHVDMNATARGVFKYGPFAYVGRVLSAACATGSDRQKIHRKLSKYSAKAWAEVRAGRPNPLVEYISTDPAFEGIDVQGLVDCTKYLGIAPYVHRLL